MVSVIMGNDFPDAVFDNEAAAKEYCKRKSAERREGAQTRIYWRVYEFKLRGGE